ncbi:MAG: zinc-dependent metalloprotease [Williamsia sp.]|nr:zinc-dependent metalloprotease [Williamsia sp.]
MNRIAVFAICFFLGSEALVAQQPRNLPNSSMTNGPTTLASNPFAARNTGPRPYNEVITPRAKTNRGLFTVHFVDDKYYFEVPDSVLGREILIVNRISKSAAVSRPGDRTVYAGDQIGKNVISFEKSQNNKLFLRSISYEENARDSAGMFQSLRNSSLQPIVAAFDIKAYANDSVTRAKGSVIDVTDYLMGDNDVLFFDPRYKRLMGLNQYQRDNSYVVGINSFQDNVEVKTVKTYMRTPTAAPGQAASPLAAFSASGTPSTYELNSSMVLLPKVPMRPRYFDQRVGYFTTEYVDFDENPQGIQRVEMITRWRLEPKPEDVEKYMKGELVEPIKQIVYYIDPSTPRKWVPFLIQGVNDWNVAFEKAGFKNAITAKVAPLKDSTWSIEGANHSAIVYKPSAVENASGPHVSDPRTGEILETHINWYHNVMNLLRDWYFIQAAAVDPRARTTHFSDSLMGQLIRFVSSHEVGHTLGLRHNWGSSSTVPVENLRNKAWVEANGHTPSIMDYARFNYVAQPEDNISEKGLFPRIGDYDKWAIEWGYRWFPEAKTPQAEVPILNKLTTEKLKNKRYMFGTEEDANDPREQNEDLGDDAMKASAYGIKNLQRILAKLPEWTREPNKDYSSLEELYGQLTGQFGRYMGHVSRNIGGIMTTPKTIEQPGMVVEFVTKAKQKEAMAFLQDQLFKTPKWMISPQINNLIDNSSPLTVISRAQEPTLTRLLSNNTFEKLLRFEAEEAGNAYTASEMVTDLKKGIWSELAARQPIDIYRRNLQKSFVEKLINIITPSSTFALSLATTTPQGRGFGASTVYSRTSDVISIAKMQLRSLAAEIRTALPSYTDAASRAHLQDELERINEALNPAAK